MGLFVDWRNTTYFDTTYFDSSDFNTRQSDVLLSFPTVTMTHPNISQIILLS